MLTAKIVEQVLLEAINAPSGDNSQPWHFVVNKNRVDVFDVSKVDTDIYNFKNRGSYIAHGALIENISIISEYFGFGTEIVLCPDSKNIDHIASIVFFDKPRLAIDLYSAISRRATNRKKYYKIPLTAEEKEKLLGSVLENEGRIVFVEEELAKKRLAKALVVSERLMLENKAVHDYLFSNISWTKDVAELKRRGLYAATLELASPKFFVFKKCEKWVVAKILSMLGLSRAVASDNAKLYSSSPAFGAIFIKNQEVADYIKAGRLMQRLWLRATLLGFSMQPIAAVPYMAQRFASGDIASFSLSQVVLVTDANSVLEKEFGCKNESLVMVFRIGKASPPSALSPKLKPEIRFQF